MPYEKKVWVDRQSEHPTRRTLTPTGNENEYDVSRAEGLVLEEGDAFDAANMNDLEKRIESGMLSVMPLYTATLLVDGWGEAASDGSYTQTAACTPQDGGPAVTASTNLLFPMCSQTGVQATDEALQAALNIINLGAKATGAGTVTCKVWELPECDITVTWPGREANNG